MIQFVTTATGEKHRAFAERLEESFSRWDWPELIVVTDKPIKARRNIVSTDDIGRGRGLKTRFAEFADGEGQICYIDADCEAVGRFEGVPIIPTGAVGGVVMARTPENTLPPEIFAALKAAGMNLHFASPFLLCSELKSAKAISEAWHTELAKLNGQWSSDEPSLNAALTRLVENIRKVDIEAHFKKPLTNLLHHAEGGGTMPITL